MQTPDFLRTLNQAIAECDTPTDTAQQLGAKAVPRTYVIPVPEQTYAERMAAELTSDTDVF